MLFRNKKQGEDVGEQVEEGYQAKPSAYPMKPMQDDSGSPFNAFSLDLRSLALFRILLGFVVIVDLLCRSRSMFSHYANLGVWPIVEAINFINPHSFSLHFSNGNIPFQVAILVVTLVTAAFFMIGLKTRANNILLWILILSLQNRNVLILNPGDDLLRMLLFWGMFLPLGERFSVDISNQGGNIPPQNNRYLSFASFSFIIQIAVVYWAGYLLKTGVEWEEGTAMYYLFSIDQYTAPFGYFVLRFPTALFVMTHLYLWFELLMPIMLVLPVTNGLVRLAACLTSLAVYTFLTICLELGLFTYAPMLASVALLPAAFWDKLVVSFSRVLSPEVHSRYWAMGGSVTLYYSTTGPFPLGTKFLLQLASTFLGLNGPILAAERDTQQQNEPMDEGPQEVDVAKFLADNRLLWVAVDGTGKRHIRHRGVLALLAEAPFTAPAVPILSKGEKAVAFIYNFYAFLFNFATIQTAIYYATPATTLPPHHTRGQGRKRTAVRISDLLALVLLVYVVWWNVGTVNSELQMPSGAQWVGLALRIDQWWAMFAPSPMKDDGWFVIPAKLANGKEVDLFKNGGGSLSYEKPMFVSKSFSDHRWRRYLMNLWSGAHQEKRLFYGRYLCRQWNWYGKGSTDKEYLLKTFRIVYLREITLPGYKVKGPEPIVLWEHQC